MRSKTLLSEGHKKSRVSLSLENIYQNAFYVLYLSSILFSFLSVYYYFTMDQWSEQHSAIDYSYSFRGDGSINHPSVDNLSSYSLVSDNNNSHHYNSSHGSITVGSIYNLMPFLLTGEKGGKKKRNIIGRRRR